MKPIFTKQSDVPPSQAPRGERTQSNYQRPCGTAHPLWQMMRAAADSGMAVALNLALISAFSIVFAKRKFGQYERERRDSLSWSQHNPITSRDEQNKTFGRLLQALRTVNATPAESFTQQGSYSKHHLLLPPDGQKIEVASLLR